MIAGIRKFLLDKINTDTHIREMIQGAGLTFMAKVVGVLAGLGTSLIVARFYGTEMVGVLAIINSVMGICIVFSLMGMDVAVLRLVPEYMQKYSASSVGCLHRKMVLIVICLALITSGVLMLFSPLLCRYIFHNTSMHFFITITAVFVVVKSLSILNIQVIWGLQKIKIYALMHSFPFILNFLIIAVLTFLLYRENNPVYALFSSILITSGVLFFLSFYLTGKMESKSRVDYRVSYNSIIELSFPMFLTSAIFVIIYQADTLMIGIFRTESEVGIYTIALKLAVLTNFVLISVQSIAAPKFSQLYHGGELEQLKKVAQDSTRVAFWIILPILLISLVFGYRILGMFGQEFTAGYIALLILLAGQFVNVAAGAVNIFLDMTGHEKTLRNIMLFAGLLNIVLNGILIPIYHINGAAIATMITGITWNVMGQQYIKKHFGYSITYIPWITRER